MALPHSFSLYCSIFQQLRLLRLGLDALRGRPGAGFVAVRGEQHVAGETPALDDFGCNRDDKAKAAGRPASNSTGRSPQSGKMKKSRMHT